MSDTNKKMDKHCYYCDKILNEEKGELDHGCLDCHHSILADRIDARDKEIDRLNKEIDRLNREAGILGGAIIKKLVIPKQVYTLVNIDSEGVANLIKD